MKVNDLTEAVNNINMNDEMQKKIIKNIETHTKKKQSSAKMHHWQKTVAAAAIAIVVLGAAAIPVRAFVNSLIQERMEALTEKEITSIAENTETQTTEADSYSRDYTASEKERYHDLYEQYKAGTFPKNEILQVDSEEAAQTHEFCYLTTTGHFYLPERELTDEELLEIIDFILKREYAFTMNYEQEHAEEIAQKKETEKEAIMANVESGGITEQQAIETASALLPAFYGITGEGMDFNHYYNEGDEMITPPTEPYYCVNWTDIISHQYYYFFISAKDGRLTSTTYSSGSQDEKALAIEEAEGKITALHKKAAAFMKEKIKETYDKEYVYYLTYNNETTTRCVKFIFAKEAGSAYEVSYLWNGTFAGFEETDLSDYENGKTLSPSMGDEKQEVKTVFVPISDN